MNSDFRISCSFPGHHKTQKLFRKLGPEGVVSLVFLWSYVAQNRPSGALSGMDDEALAVAGQWHGDSAEFVNALVSIGFLDRKDDCLIVHDWEIHNGYAFGHERRSRTARENIQKRWMKTKGHEPCTPVAAVQADTGEHTATLPKPYDGNTAVLPEPYDAITPVIPVSKDGNTPYPYPSPSPKHMLKFDQNPSDHPPAERPAADPSKKDHTSEFLEFWDAYPRKVGKDRAWKTWNARIKERCEPAEMIQAAKNYADDCRSRKTEDRFIKHPATFLGPDWIDWLNPSDSSSSGDSPDDDELERLYGKGYQERERRAAEYAKEQYRREQEEKAAKKAKLAAAEKARLAEGDGWDT